MHKWDLSLIPLACLIMMTVAIPAVPDDSIPFSQAREIILAQNAGIKSIRSDIEAAQEGVRQARVFPNPSGSITLEKFGANEIEATIGQTIELGGKRRMRTEAAQKEQDAVLNRLKQSGLALEAEIVRRIIPIAIHSRKLVLLDSIIATAEANRGQIRRKVEAGALKTTDLVRTEIGIEQLALERSEIEREIAQSRKRFAALGGSADTVLLKVSAVLKTDMEIPSLDEFRNSLKNNPRLAGPEIQAALLEVQKRQLKAASVPDLNLSAGYVNKMRESINAPLVGFSMDLPLFNRYAAAQKQIDFQRQALIMQRENELRILDAEVQDLFSRLMEIGKKIDALRSGTIPKAEKVCTMLQDFYHAGNASFLDLTTVQSELLRLRMSMLDLESERAFSAADLMEMTSCTIQITE